MSRRRSLRRRAALLRPSLPLLALAFALGTSSKAQAAPITAGFDLFMTGPCIPNSVAETGVCENGGVSPESFTVTAVPLALQPVVAPDPPTVLLFGSGLIGLAVVGRRRARSLGTPGSPSLVDPTGPAK